MDESRIRSRSRGGFVWAYKILVEKEYLGTYPFAISYVEELIADIQQNIHSKLKKKAPAFLNVMVRICITSLINVILIRRGIFFLCHRRYLFY